MKAPALYCLTALTGIFLVGCGDSPTPVHQPTPTDDRTQIAELKEQIAELKEAAEKGDLKAQLELNSIYAYGEGVPKDDKEAVKWLRMAAEQEYELDGDPHLNFTPHLISDAQWRLGNQYWFGGIVPQDYEEAIKWYRKAAEQGNVDAQCGLGFMYENGEGVPEDHIQAYAWFKIAQANGNEWNECGGEVLLRTYEQLAEAKKLVGEMIMASPNLLNGLFSPLF